MCKSHKIQTFKGLSAVSTGRVPWITHFPLHWAFILSPYSQVIDYQPWALFCKIYAHRLRAKHKSHRFVVAGGLFHRKPHFCPRRTSTEFSHLAMISKWYWKSCQWTPFASICKFCRYLQGQILIWWATFARMKRKTLHFGHRNMRRNK